MTERSSGLFSPTPAAQVVDLAGHRQQSLSPAAVRRAKKSAEWRPEPFSSYATDVSHLNKIYGALSGFLLYQQRKGLVDAFSLTPSPIEEIDSAGEFWQRCATLKIGKVEYTLTLYSSIMVRHATQEDSDYGERLVQETVMRIENSGANYLVYAPCPKGGPKSGRVPPITDPTKWRVYSGPKSKPVVETFVDFLARHHPTRVVSPAAPSRDDSIVMGGPIGSDRMRFDKGHLRAITPAEQAQEGTTPTAKARRKPKRVAQVKKRPALSAAAKKKLAEKTAVRKPASKKVSVKTAPKKAAPKKTISTKPAGRPKQSARRSTTRRPDR